jgi:xanthine dehydrogenase YagS FAD-binding subunit
VRRFQLHEPASLGAALSDLANHGLDARPLGGGTDLVAGLMRDNVAGSAMPYPRHLVDVTRVPELRGIRRGPGGLAIGAATSLAEIAESAAVHDGWPLLAAAAAEVASPEIRVIGTLGGNLAQRPRCWFFRNRDFDCIKKGGTICYAVKGDNRYNAILDGNICFIVHPSDLGTALVALGAEARIASARRERTVSLDRFFVGPAENLVAETCLEPDELLVEVFLPEVPRTARQVWRKVNEKGRPTWDFALVSVAIIGQLAGDAWQTGRIVLGAVAPVPYRAVVVEAALAGRPVAAAVPGAVAALRAAARPMRDNGWKLELAAVTLEEALIELSQRPGRP